MENYLEYRQLTWGGYVVNDEYAMLQAVQQQFGDNRPPNLVLPVAYPLVIWFDNRKPMWIEMPAEREDFNKKMSFLMVRFYQHNYREIEVPEVPPTAIPDVLQTFVGLAHMRRRVGWELRKMFDKWWAVERHQKKSRFFISIHASAVEWDFYPPGIKEDGTIQCWFTNAHPDSTSDGLMDPFRKIVHYLHYEGYRPTIPWDAIDHVGAARPDGSVSRLYIQQQLETPPLLDSLQDICHMLQHVGIEFEERPEEDK